MRGAVADRARAGSDPDIEAQTNASFDGFLAPAQIAARKAKIDLNKTRQAPEFVTHEQGTTHITIADREGNVVALTTTINAPFGAVVVAGNTGIILNNELDDFSSPKDIEGFHVVGLGSNRPPSPKNPSGFCPPQTITSFPVQTAVCP